MKKDLSPALFFAHARAAEALANDYLNDLANVRLGTEDVLSFGTLEARFQSFRREYCQRVRAHAAVRGIHRFDVRTLELVAFAKADIAARLKANPALAARLASIRDTQARVEDARARREALKAANSPSTLALVAALASSFAA